MEGHGGKCLARNKTAASKARPGLKKIQDSLDEGKRDAEFWRHMDATFGMRKELLLVAVSIAVSMYFTGAAKTMADFEFWLAAIGYVVLLWGSIGLVVAHLVRAKFIQEPDLIEAFMLKANDGTRRYFQREVMQFLIDSATTKRERGAMTRLRFVDRLFRILGLHAPWLLPFLIIAFMIGAILLTSN